MSFYLIPLAETSPFSSEPFTFFSFSFLSSSSVFFFSSSSIFFFSASSSFFFFLFSSFSALLFSSSSANFFAFSFSSSTVLTKRLMQTSASSSSDFGIKVSATSAGDTSVSSSNLSISPYNSCDSISK
ncbi:hypothetical protein YC2023_113136 [Brassica napus]